MSDLNPYEEGLAVDLAKAQARIKELEAKLDKAVDFCRRLERFAQGTNDPFLLDRCREILGELTDAQPD
jgi:hypothetical protein